MFPEEEMLGIDLVIPNISYLREKQKTLLSAQAPERLFYTNDISGIPP